VASFKPGHPPAGSSLQFPPAVTGESKAEG
jgi:hypothetical protein